MMKKFLSGLVIGAFVFGLGAAEMSTASAAKPEYGKSNGQYDQRAHEFGLGNSDKYQNLAKPEYGKSNGQYDQR